MKTSILSTVLLASAFTTAGAVPAAGPASGSGVGTSVCTAAPNSFSATGATLTASGTTSLTASSLTFEVAAVPPGELGLLLVGFAGPQFPFNDGFLCYDLAPGVARLNRYIASPTGDASLPLNFSTLPAPVPVVGATWTFTVIYRDCLSTGAMANSTNGVELTFTP